MRLLSILRKFIFLYLGASAGGVAGASVGGGVTGAGADGAAGASVALFSSFFCSPQETSENDAKSAAITNSLLDFILLSL